MSMVYLYDTTLRDGAQTEGISYSVKDKLRITEKLDALGVHYIEGGWPGSNPKDLAFFKEAKKERDISVRNTLLCLQILFRNKNRPIHSLRLRCIENKVSQLRQYHFCFPCRPYCEFSHSHSIFYRWNVSRNHEGKYRASQN